MGCVAKKEKGKIWRRLCVVKVFQKTSKVWGGEWTTNVQMHSIFIFQIYIVHFWWPERGAFRAGGFWAFKIDGPGSLPYRFKEEQHTVPPP